MERLEYLELKVQEALDEMRKCARYDDRGNLVHYQPRHRKKLKMYVDLRTEEVLNKQREKSNE